MLPLEDSVNKQMLTTNDGQKGYSMAGSKRPKIKKERAKKVQVKKAHF